MATTLLLDSIKKKVDKGLMVGATFIDFSKAFDTISHARILEQLPSYGIPGSELDWMSSYLFSIDNFTSNLQPCLNGVPPGSILGPVISSEVMLFGTTKRIFITTTLKSFLQSTTPIATPTLDTIGGTLKLNSDFELSYKRVATRLKLFSNLRGY